MYAATSRVCFDVDKLKLKWHSYYNTIRYGFVHCILQRNDTDRTKNVFFKYNVVRSRKW